MVGLIDYHDLEPLFGRLIYLLRLRYFLEQLLDNDTVVSPNIRRREFKVIYGGDNVEFELAVTASLEHSGIYLDFLNTRSI